MSDLYIETTGCGEVHVVLLHGWAMHGGVLAPLAQALARHATVHVVDLPGHGRSRGADVPFQPCACAHAIAVATPPAMWLGWSLGGLIALAGALAYPRQVQSLAILCASPCFVRKDGWRYGMSPETLAELGTELERDYHATLERFLELEALGSRHAREETRHLRATVFARGEPNPQALVEGIRLLRDTDLRAALPELACPSVWIAGSRDRLVPWQGMRESASACDGRFARIDHAGHAPFLGFVDAVEDALSPLLPTTIARKQA